MLYLWSCSWYSLNNIPLVVPDIEINMQLKKTEVVEYFYFFSMAVYLCKGQKVKQIVVLIYHMQCRWLAAVSLSDTPLTVNS